MSFSFCLIDFSIFSASLGLSQNLGFSRIRFSSSSSISLPSTSKRPPQRIQALYNFLNMICCNSHDKIILEYKYNHFRHTTENYNPKGVTVLFSSNCLRFVKTVFQFSSECSFISSLLIFSCVTTSNVCPFSSEMR